MKQMMSAMLRQFSVFMRMGQMGAERQAANAELELFPPGTLSLGQNSQPKLAALADASRGPATPPPRSSVDSPVADAGDGGRKAAVGEGATPRCLAILDKNKEEDEPPDGTAAAMRGAIVMSRASLIADRAKKAADVKKAANNNRFTFL